MRAAGLWSGAGQALAAKGLGADDGADLVAVHIHVADAHARTHFIDGRFDAGVKTESEAEAGGIDLIADFAQTVTGKAHDMQDGAEDLTLKDRDRRDFIGSRGNEGASLRVPRMPSRAPCTGR